ncbi:MAG TPA: NAD(P)/FAD-dependent oxidoreductase [Thermoanaerobaculia bacterium]|nr:NAD(P)/FAD-dependent oxidoreductase [Thermoanaerobaculia bacterium]
MYDVIVIGGSWAGLAAALQLVRARRRVLIVDAGRPRNRFARTAHGFLGQDGKTPVAIVEEVRGQVLSYPTAEHRVDEALQAWRAGEGSGEGFAVGLASGATVHGRRLMLATGIVDDLPEIPGLRERWGATVLHCPYCHGYEMADRRLGVLAVGEHSLHSAMLIRDWSEHVTLFTDGVLEPGEGQRAALEARGVRVEERTVEELLGSGPALEGVRLRGGDVVPLEALFTTSRTRMASPLAEQLGCEFKDGRFGPVIVTDRLRETTVPGVYAAGDAVRSSHNATWAASDGVTAGISAHQSLLPRLPASPE